MDVGGVHHGMNVRIGETHTRPRLGVYTWDLNAATEHMSVEDKRDFKSHWSFSDEPTMCVLAEDADNRLFLTVHGTYGGKRTNARVNPVTKDFIRRWEGVYCPDLKTVEVVITLFPPSPTTHSHNDSFYDDRTLSVLMKTTTGSGESPALAWWRAWAPRHFATVSETSYQNCIRVWSDGEQAAITAKAYAEDVKLNKERLRTMHMALQRLHGEGGGRSSSSTLSTILQQLWLQPEKDFIPPLSEVPRAAIVNNARAQAEHPSTHTPVARPINFNTPTRILNDRLLEAYITRNYKIIANQPPLS
jgi:hypothetical protein